ncbi:MAG: TonB-dependent receptor [Sphingomonadaceae bacterium]
MKNPVRIWRAILLSGAASLMAAPAFAQEPEPAEVDTAAEAEAEAEAASYEEGDTIVVTARRREEALIDVPISITSYSGEELRERGAIDLTDIDDTTPNVTLEASRGTNSTLTAFIRGVGQQDPVAGFEQGVGIYIDDVYLNRPQAALLEIYDVERIEVLRGPQGTLYGRNTIGGAIKYVSRRIGPDPELRLRASYGTYDKLDLVAGFGVPLAEGVRFGGTVAWLTRDGFGDNLNLSGIENYNKDILAGRLALEFQPTDRIFVRLSGDYTDDDSDPRQGHRLIPGQLSGAPVLDDVYDTRAGLDAPEQEVEAYGGALHAEIELDEGLMLRSITAWREDESFSPIDFDSLPAADLDVPVVYRNDQFSQEVQLVYDRGAFAGVAGFYYLSANAFNAFDVILATTGALLGLPGLNAFTQGEVDTETWSVFGDFTWDITDRLSVSLGGRYTHDERRSAVLRQTKIGGLSPIFGGTATPIVTTSDFEGERSFEEFTPRASLSFRPTPDHNLYASYARGFKGGGFDPRGLSTAAPDLDGDGVVDEDEIFDFFAFEPETVDSYELGWKASLLDNRLNFSLAAFQADYEDVQIPGSVGVDTDGDGVFDSFVGITTNAGRARFRGIEFEGLAVLARDFGTPGDRLNLGWSLGYLDAEYLEFIDNRGIDVADLREVQNTPDWTASGTLEYETPAAGGFLNIVTILSYRGDSTQFEIPNAFIDQDGFALWDASLVWRDDAERWSLGLHAKNITDERYKTSGYTFVAQNPDGSFVTRPDGSLIPTLGLEGTLTAFYGDPRQVWLTLGLNF